MKWFTILAHADRVRQLWQKAAAVDGGHRDRGGDLQPLLEGARRASYHAYERWGAWAVCRSLDYTEEFARERQPKLEETASLVGGSSRVWASSSDISLDLATVLQAGAHKEAPRVAAPPPFRE